MLFLSGTNSYATNRTAMQSSYCFAHCHDTVNIVITEPTGHQQATEKPTVCRSSPKSGYRFSSRNADSMGSAYGLVLHRVLAACGTQQRVTFIRWNSSDQCIMLLQMTQVNITTGKCGRQSDTAWLPWKLVARAHHFTVIYRNALGDNFLYRASWRSPCDHCWHNRNPVQLLWKSYVQEEICTDTHITSFRCTQRQEVPTSRDSLSHPTVCIYNINFHHIYHIKNMFMSK